MPRNQEYNEVYNNKNRRKMKGYFSLKKKRVFMKCPKELGIVNKYLSSLSIRYLTEDQ